MSASSAPQLPEHAGEGPRRDLRGYGRHPPRVAWPDGARLALSVVLVLEEGSEYSHAAGDGRNEGAGEIPVQLPPPYRDLTAESVWEYGSRAGVWRLARLFDALEIPVTVLGTAVSFERLPEVGAWLREAGHEPCCHGWRHEELWTLSAQEERARLHAAVASIERTCGTRPRGWISRYAPSVRTRELLVEEGGFVYDSDAFNDDLPYHVDVAGCRHLVIPHTFTYNDGRYVLPQGFSDPGSFVEQCRRGLDYLWDEGATHPKLMTISLHARIAGQAARASAVAELLAYARGKGGVWLARRVDIARWWNEHCEGFSRTA